jgi:RHS repeat-associated protein
VKSDSSKALDYADQRFYASSYGRFNMADPSWVSVGSKDPGSWNRYSYPSSDPVNRNDPTGLDDWCDYDPDVACDYSDPSSGFGSPSGFLPCNGSGGNCSCIGAVVLDPTCVSVYGTTQAVAWLAASARAQLNQEYQQCVSQVKTGAQAQVAALQVTAANIRSVNGLVATSIELVTAATTGVLAGAFVSLPIIAATAPEAAAIGGLTAVASLVVAGAGGAVEQAALAAAVQVMVVADKTIIRDQAGQQISKCASMYPGGQ